MNTWLLALAFFVKGITSQGQFVLDVIGNNPDFSLFADLVATALESDEDSSLTDSSQILTVFVPNNTAVLDDPTLSNYSDTLGWNVHLQEIINLHVVVGSALPRPAIFNFDGAANALETTSGPIEVSKEAETVAGQIVLEGGTSARNGIVHEVGGVFLNPWRGISLLERISFATPRMEQAVISAGLEDELNSLVSQFGTTFASVALEDDSAQEAARNTLLYSVIDENLYSGDFSPGVRYLATPRSEEAHLWVTMDADGALRFNDAVATGFEMAENGVFYVLDKAISPPSIVELLGITGFYSNMNVINAYELFTSSTWNLTDLASSLGYDEEGKLTMFAPVDGALTILSLNERERLMQPAWSSHLEDLLKHWLIDGSYSQDELRDAVDASSDDSFELTMLSGSSVAVSVDSTNGDLFIDGGRFFQPANLRGVDRLIQVIGTFLQPPSFRYSVYERARLDPDMAEYISVVEESGLEGFFSKAFDQLLSLHQIPSLGQNMISCSMKRLI